VAVPIANHTRGEFVEHAKTDDGPRQTGSTRSSPTKLSAWKLQQKPEARQTYSLVIETAKGGPSRAANFWSREFRPALARSLIVEFHQAHKRVREVLDSILVT
jgi:hypothetical protein